MSMIELTPAQRRDFRARAHHLSPVVTVADNGLTPGVDHLVPPRPLGIAVAQHLRDPVMVAQIDEQHAAVVADPVDPARKPDGFTHMGRVQRGTGVAAIGVHS